MAGGLVRVDYMVAIVKCVCGCVSVNVEARFLFLLWLLSIQRVLQLLVDGKYRNKPLFFFFFVCKFVYLAARRLSRNNASAR